ncbi:unnamed protein product [Owenia fusiformis]|uniref:L-Fucosyltransferase n=1 Tax=Owenia fusiformis TaxID=6347 RepID=A0A8S4NF69_OWEFU|nr:unnamed protein product [Owenia fusiformis]
MIRAFARKIPNMTACFKRCLFILVPFSFMVLLYLSLGTTIVQRTMPSMNQMNQANNTLNKIIRGAGKYTGYSVGGANPNNSGTSAPKEKQTRFFISGSYTGRLGNLMFEYAGTLGIAKSNNFTMLVNEKHELYKYFNLSGISTPSGKPNKTVRIGENGCCKFTSRLMDIKPKRNVTVGLYLQSFKYFQNVSMKIRREFTFHDDISATAKEFIANVTKMEKNLTLVGIHVRRGDLLSKDKIKFGYTTPNTTYFIHAMNYFRKKYSNVKFIVCSDDRKWWEKNMNLTNVVISKGTKAEEDMAILSKCDHMIISTGTFGWWAAFLANGTTIYYNNWPGVNTALGRQTKHEDYFMPHWIPMGEDGPLVKIPTPKESSSSAKYYIGGAYTGRIGNLMFQYAARYAIGRANNLTVLTRNNSELHNYFKLSALRAKTGMPENDTRMFESGCCRFTKSLTKIEPKKNITLHTYLQSYKYWYNISNEIKRQFVFNEEIDRNATKFHTGVTGNANNVTVVGIHVRRGDIANMQRFINFGYTVPNLTYYDDAMNFFRNKFNNVKFILCSDDITWSVENFKKFPDVIISNGNSPVEDMAILSKCGHMIMSTGSFGWWAGFLSNGITVYYENWPRLSSKLSQQVVKEDYFPPGWIPMT